MQVSKNILLDKDLNLHGRLNYISDLLVELLDDVHCQKKYAVTVTEFTALQKIADDLENMLDILPHPKSKGDNADE